MQNIFVLVLLIFTSFFSFVLDDKDLYLLFGVQLFIITIHLLLLRHIFFLFSPLILLVYYISISLFVGGWAFENGHILSSYLLQQYSEWSNMNISTFYLLASISIVYYIDSRYRSAYKSLITQKKILLNRASVSYIFIFMISLMFVINIPLNLGFFGGSGNLSQIFITTGIFLIIVFLLSRSNSVPFLIRALVYLLIMSILIKASVNSKREAVFVIFAIMFIELYIKNLKYSISTIIGAVFFSIFILAIVAYMSILRGYGNFELSDNVNDMLLLEDYLLSKMFIPSFMDNMEFSFFYYNAYNSIEVILNNPDLMTWGLTLIKPLFILIPRSLAPFKPDSILNIYTKEVNPELALVGGTWPISIFGEFFWNFQFLSLFFVLLFSIIVIRVYYNFLIALPNMQSGMIAFGLLVYMVFIMLVRGSGFDLFIIYSISSFIFVYIVNIIHKLLSASK
jgi:hypothetical protein